MLSRLPRRTRRAHWLVWLALFGLTLAPAVSRGLSAMDPAGQASVCRVAAPGAGPRDEAGHLDHVLQACELCLVAATAWLPVHRPTTALAPVRWELQAPATPAEPAWREAWRADQPRAPPRSLSA